MLAALSSSTQRELKSLDVTGGEVSAQLSGISGELIHVQARVERRVAYENLIQELNWDAVTGFVAEVLAEATSVAPELVEVVG